MMLAIMYDTVILLAIVALFGSLTEAHSWVEELTAISPNGTFVGAKGYPRGNVPRSPSFNDQMMQWQLPTNQGNKLLDNMTICRPSQQTKNYTQGSPPLQAAPGAVVALRYQENGHVTQPWIKSGKPEHSGIVYVYGTNQPREDDTLLAIHKVWNLDGTGGDRRGRLLTTQYFDDGQCYQVDDISPISVERQKEFPRKPGAGSVEGANLWCQTDVAMPNDLQSGSSYTLYWVWDWSTLDTHNTTYLPELYTTCMDIDVTGSMRANNDANVAFAQVTNYGGAAIQTIYENLKNHGTQIVPGSGQQTTAAPSPLTAIATSGPTSVPNPASPAGQAHSQPQADSNCGTPTTVTVTVPTTVTATAATVTITLS